MGKTVLKIPHFANVWAQFSAKWFGTAYPMLTPFYWGKLSQRHFNDTNSSDVFFFFSFSGSCHSNSDGSNQRRPLTSMCKYSFKECTIRNRHELQSKVCGSNGRTYKNICLMKRHSCSTVGRAITLEHRGPCRSGVTKEGTTRNKMNRGNFSRTNRV